MLAFQDFTSTEPPRHERRSDLTAESTFCENMWADKRAVRAVIATGFKFYSGSSGAAAVASVLQPRKLLLNQCPAVLRKLPFPERDAVSCSQRRLSKAAVSTNTDGGSHLQGMQDDA